MFVVAFVLIVSVVAIAIFSTKLDRALNNAPTIAIGAQFNDPFPKVSVIIPAYNEADNIEACVTSVLDSTTLNADQLEVWVVDDQSSDETKEIVELLQASRQDARLKTLAAGVRPAGEVWVGKNWACTQAVKQVQGEFLLFVDADVRLKPQSIETTIAYAQQEKIDLLSLAVVILCRHWSEWLAQPIIVMLLAVGFEFTPVNDPMSETAFAAGPFMLFRRSAYDAIGGHAAVHNYVVEDVELSRRIKQQNFKLWYGLGRGLAEVQMYRSFSALWEGWTKNWFEGSNRNYQAALYCVFVTFLIFCHALDWVDDRVNPIGAVWLNTLDCDRSRTECDRTIAAVFNPRQERGGYVDFAALLVGNGSGGIACVCDRVGVDRQNSDGVGLDMARTTFRISFKSASI